jgi:hypothetical protein
MSSILSALASNDHQGEYQVQAVADMLAIKISLAYSLEKCRHEVTPQIRHDGGSSQRSLKYLRKEGLSIAAQDPWGNTYGGNYC